MMSDPRNIRSYLTDHSHHIHAWMAHTDLAQSNYPMKWIRDQLLQVGCQENADLKAEC